MKIEQPLVFNMNDRLTNPRHTNLRSHLIRLQNLLKSSNLKLINVEVEYRQHQLLDCYLSAKSTKSLHALLKRQALFSQNSTSIKYLAHHKCK